MNITSASRQYATRPKDERFESIEKLIEAGQKDKDLCREKTYPLQSLSVVPSTGIEGLHLQNQAGQTANFTNWSFGQLCRTVGAPANYLSKLPADIASKALNHSIQTTASIKGNIEEDKVESFDINLLLRANGGTPTVRSFTSEKYGRLWDADFYNPILRNIVDKDSRWTTPPTWSGENAGAYRGDRDSFVIITNGGSIVNDPSAGEGGQLYRGLLLRNSEVGASAVVIERILFRYICGNHILWGAVIDETFSRRHIGKHVLRDTTKEIVAVAHAWANQSARRDEELVRSLISAEIAKTKEEVVKELRKLGSSKDAAESAYDKCVATENLSPRSFWGLAQGYTRLSQDSGYQDERFQLDQLAAKVLARGRSLVAA